MDSQASRTGLLVSALGGVALAIGVFLPWYGVSFSQASIDAIQGQLTNLPAPYGSFAARLGAAMGQHASALVGHEFLSLSAHQALSRISIVLLVVGVIATLIALFALAQSRPVLPHNAAGLLALGGAVAAMLVLYRILSPISSGVMAVSVKPAAWLCLLGSVAIAAGAMWPIGEDAPAAADTAVWSELSGWTPGR